MISAQSKERKAKCEEWAPVHFQQDLKTGQWVYKHSDLRPWDPRNDLYQYEYEYKILTRTKHPTPMIRTASIVGVESKQASFSDKKVLCFFLQFGCNFYILLFKGIDSRSGLKSNKRKGPMKQISSDIEVDDTSTDEFHSDSSHVVNKEKIVGSTR